MKAKEFIPQIKPRNFVAKNQKTAGAGQHKDKKRAEKQGDVKHKNKQYDEGVAEGISVVDQDYDLDQVILTLDIEGKRAEFTYTDYDENFENAERKDVFDQLQEKSWYKGLDHPTKMEILDAAYKAIRGEEPSEYKPTVDDEPMDDGDLLDDLVGERVRDPEDWDEGNTEPPNNFAVYINGKKWKILKGRGYYADDERERQHYYQLKDWARKKSETTGKKWEVYITGEPANESVEEDTEIPFNKCPSCSGPIFHESLMNEKQDACYHKVRSRYKVWPSAYASGALVQCRKKGAKNWGNKSK